MEICEGDTRLLYTMKSVLPNDLGNIVHPHIYSNIVHCKYWHHSLWHSL